MSYNSSPHQKSIKNNIRTIVYTIITRQPTNFPDVAGDDILSVACYPRHHNQPYLHQTPHHNNRYKQTMTTTINQGTSGRQRLPLVRLVWLRWLNRLNWWYRYNWSYSSSKGGTLLELYSKGTRWSESVRILCKQQGRLDYGILFRVGRAYLPALPTLQLSVLFRADFIICTP